MLQFQKSEVYKSVSKGHSPIKETKVVGQCYYHLHKGYLTYTTLKGHKCLEKNCRFFVMKPGVNIQDINEQKKNQNRNQTYIDLLRKLKKYKIINQEQYNKMKNVSKEQKCEIITKYTKKLYIRKKLMKPINILIAKYKRIKALIKRFFTKQDTYTKIAEEQGCSRKKAKQIFKNQEVK